VLRPLAREEKARRRPDRSGMYRLRFGLPLDSMSRSNGLTSLHHRDFGDVVRTPLGTCLLLERPVISEEVLERATEYARSLRTTTAERR